MKKLYTVILILLAAAMVFAVVYTRNTDITKSDYALDTIIKVSVKGKDAKKATDEIFEQIKKDDNLLSAYKESSEVSFLNKEKSLSTDTETAKIISDSVVYSEKTNGYFDITIKPLSDLWDIKNNTGYIPSDEEINNSLKSVGYKNIKTENGKIVLEGGASVDLGGVAKGYCANKATEILKTNNIKEAIIDLGGNVYVFGNRNFKVGIQNPDGERGEYFGICNVKNTSVVTSGAYERYFVKDGKMYHHILSPFTGKCADSDLKSVTVVGEDSQKCDAFSTAVFAMGKDEGIKVLKNEPDLMYIIVDSDNNVYTSKELDFEITDKNFKSGQ